MVLVVAQCRCFFAAAFLFAGSKKRVEREREFVLFLCGRLIFLNKIFSHHDLHFFSLFYFFFCLFFLLVVLTFFKHKTTQNKTLDEND